MKKYLFVISLILLIPLLLLITYRPKTTLEEEIEEPKMLEVIEPEEKRMSLVAVGDALIHSGIYTDAYIGNGNYDFSDMFEEIKPLIEDYDLKYYNQETIIGGKDLGISNYPNFNSPDEIGQNLVDIGFNLVSLANNHSMDKGERGILYSVNFWKKQNIVFSGQASSYEERNNIVIYEVNKIKYAFIAYTDGTNGIIIPKDKEYLINVYSNEKAKKDIDSIKDKADVIIVSMHWGEEYSHTPTLTQKEEAKYLSSLGVNLIIGSHPHVIQPIDYIDNTLVIYSLGNFISSQRTLGLNKIIGLMVGVDIVVKDGVVSFENLDYKLLYTYDNNYKNYKVIPFENLTDEILKNYEKIEQDYINIVESEVIYD